MLIRIGSVGLRRFASFYENRIDVFLNMMSLIAFCALAKDYVRTNYDFSSSVSLGWYLLIETTRLFKLFFVVNDIKIFEHMLAVLIRASFLYFAIVYFFAVFGYAYLCDALSPIAAAQTNALEDDAAQWVQYQNILNFHTLLQSCFTMFEMSILGNWSMVMDAAVATGHPVRAYAFFYTYRILATLFVLPILISFIIQVFLSAMTLREKQIAKEQEIHRQSLVSAKQQQQKKSMRKSSSSHLGVLTAGLRAGDYAYPTNDDGNGNENDSESAAGSSSSSMDSSSWSTGGGNGTSSLSPSARPTSSSFFSRISSRFSSSVPPRATSAGSASYGPAAMMMQPSTVNTSATGTSSRTTSTSDTHSGSAAAADGGAAGSSSGAGSGSGGGTPPRRGLERRRSMMPVIKLGVDKQGATNARDKHSEEIHHAAGDSSGYSIGGTGGDGVSGAGDSDSATGGGGGGNSASVTTVEAASAASGAATGNSSIKNKDDGNGNPRENADVAAGSAGPPSEMMIGSGAAGAGANPAGASRITVQYDTSGSSMMNIWTIDGNNPLPTAKNKPSSSSSSKNKAAAAAAAGTGGVSEKGGGTSRAEKVKSTRGLDNLIAQHQQKSMNQQAMASSNNDNNSNNSNLNNSSSNGGTAGSLQTRTSTSQALTTEQQQVRQLQDQLDAALRALENEKLKTKTLQTQVQML